MNRQPASKFIEKKAKCGAERKKAKKYFQSDIEIVKNWAKSDAMAKKHGTVLS